MTNLETLKALHAQLGGTEEAVAGATTTLEVLNAISAIYDGESGTQIANAIYEISKVATGGGGKGFGKKTAVVLGQQWTLNASGQCSPILYNAPDFNPADYTNERHFAEIVVNGQSYDAVAWAYEDNGTAKFAAMALGNIAMTINGTTFQCYEMHDTTVTIAVNVYSERIFAAPVHFLLTYTGTDESKINCVFSYWTLNSNNELVQVGDSVELPQSDQQDAILLVAYGDIFEAFCGVVPTNAGDVQLTYKQGNVLMFGAAGYKEALRIIESFEAIHGNGFIIVSLNIGDQPLS